MTVQMGATRYEGKEEEPANYGKHQFGGAIPYTTVQFDGQYRWRGRTKSVLRG